MDRPFKRVKVGDIIVCCDPFAHDYEEYLLRVTSIETEKAEITGADEDCLVAYGEGLTKEDHDYIEESGFPFAIHENAFVCFSKVCDKEVSGMNELARTVKARILSEYKKHPYIRFAEHRDLLAMSCDAEMFLVGDEEPEELGIEEIVFAVEKQWLIDYKNRDKYEWNDEKVRWWLQNEYVSDDSKQIFDAAMAEGMVAMIEIW